MQHNIEQFADFGLAKMIRKFQNTLPPLSVSVNLVAHEEVSAPTKGEYLRGLARKFKRLYPVHGVTSNGYQFLMQQAALEDMRDASFVKTDEHERTP